MVSPGYSYSKAPDQEHFLRRQRTHELFRGCSSSPKRRWRFNQSPLFLQFLMGKQDFECTPWGNPTYNIFGWQRPCYLLQGATRATFEELIGDHRWENYGQEERQREVPRLHGALRVRGDGRQDHTSQLGAGLPGHGGGHRDRTSCDGGRRRPSRAGRPSSDAEMPLAAEVVELAFDYRGNTTVVRSGTAPRSTATSSTATRTRPCRSSRCSMPSGGGPYRVPYAEVRTIQFTGKDTAAGKSYAAWLARKQAEKAGRAAGPPPP